MTHLAFLQPLLFAPGDRMSREEFLERWDKMPAVKFAELVDGVVYVPSPLSHEHSLRDGRMQLILGNYAARTPACEMLPNASWLMLDSVPQPDIALRLLPQYGGRAQLSGKLVQGAPELIVEIALSSRAYDLGPKLALYQRAGVNEYVAVLLEEQRVEWRVLESGSYFLQTPDARGILRSRGFPGLWLDENAFWQDDPERLLAVLEEGLRSPEYNEFRARLTAPGA